MTALEAKKKSEYYLQKIDHITIKKRVDDVLNEIFKRIKYASENGLFFIEYCIHYGKEYPIVVNTLIELGYKLNIGGLYDEGGELYSVGKNYIIHWK